MTIFLHVWSVSGLGVVVPLSPGPCTSIFWQFLSSSVAHALYVPRARAVALGGTDANVGMSVWPEVNLNSLYIH